MPDDTKPLTTQVYEITVTGPLDAIRELTGENMADSALDGLGFPFDVEATGRKIAQSYRRVPTHIAAKHPAVDLIKCMLMRRGDNEGVAQGRGIALVEALIDTGMLREDGDFLPYDHGRGIINIEEPKP